MIVVIKKKTMDQIGVVAPQVAAAPVSTAPTTKKVTVIKRKSLTLMQQAVVAQVGKGLKNKGEILRNAGYSVSVSKKPEKVFSNPTVIKAVEPILARLERHRDKVLARMEKIYGKAGYTSLSITLAHMNKDIELLSGRPTSRETYQLPDEEQARLRKLLAMNSKKQ